jgi:ketosteroid isomerase-like protein
MTDQDIRARNLAAVEGAFAAIGKGDADGQVAHYTDDAVMEMPFIDPPAITMGKAAIRERLAGAFTVFRFTLTIERVTECLDPDELVLEFTSEGTVTTTGKPYANRYIARFQFRDGKICFQREYFNPNAAALALTPD